MQTRKKKSTEQRPDPDVDFAEEDSEEDYDIPADKEDEDDFGYLDEEDAAEDEDSQE